MEEIDFSKVTRIADKTPIKNVQMCVFCESEIPVSYSRPGICNSCRDAVLWARCMMETERIEKLNEKTRKEDEERWRKIMQGTV